jgi:tRNA (adenine-N(1)-)-methyltransferase non-catalytic subunit
MFFSAGLEPARKGNRSALAAANRRVWPVLLAWTYFNQTGMVQDSAGWLSCATTGESKRAPRGRVRSVLDPEDLAVHKSRAALLLGILIASAMLVGPW